MNAPRTLYIGAVQIVTATIIKWLCNTATVRIRFSWSWYRPKFLCLTLCVTFSTHITISLSTLRSIPSNLAEPQISSSSCSELKKLICIPKFNPALNSTSDTSILSPHHSCNVPNPTRYFGYPCFIIAEDATLESLVDNYGYHTSDNMSELEDDKLRYSLRKKKYDEIEPTKEIGPETETVFCTLMRGVSWDKWQKVESN